MIEHLNIKIKEGAPVSYHLTDAEEILTEISGLLMHGSGSGWQGYMWQRIRDYYNDRNILGTGGCGDVDYYSISSSKIRPLKPGEQKAFLCKLIAEVCDIPITSETIIRIESNTKNGKNITMSGGWIECELSGKEIVFGD